MTRTLLIRNIGPSVARTAVLLCLVGIFAFSGASAQAFWDDKFTEVVPQGAEIRLPAKDITATAAFYSLPAQKADGTKVDVHFFAVRDSQGQVHLALDACDSCWPAAKGYVQDGEAFRCENCGMLFNVTRIGMKKGGCNPHPVNFTEVEGNIVIQLEELQQGAQYFK